MALSATWPIFAERFKFRIDFGCLASIFPVDSGDRGSAASLLFETSFSGDIGTEERAEADTSVLICKEPFSYWRRLRVASRSS